MSITESDASKCRLHITHRSRSDARSGSLARTSMMHAAAADCPRKWWPSAPSRRDRLCAGSSRVIMASAWASMQQRFKRSDCSMGSPKSRIHRKIRWASRFQPKRCRNASDCADGKWEAMQDDVEVHIDLDGEVRRVGTLYAPRRGPRAPVTFEYDRAWLDDPNRFSLEPALQLGRGAFAPHDGLFGSIGDSTPDTWGRRLMHGEMSRERMERDRRRSSAWPARSSTTISSARNVSDFP
jgi:HipA N-terminal domain